MDQCGMDLVCLRKRRPQRTRCKWMRKVKETTLHQHHLRIKLKSKKTVRFRVGGFGSIPLTRTTEFYRTFWSLQLPFSRPPLFAETKTFSQFKEAVNKVMPVIKEATAKERALMGSKTLLAGTGASLKRKREPESVTESVGKEYFFAKYLTSPELLDLEVSLSSILSRHTS